MAITTKSRKDLKSYFVKNAIPTESNFADLVDAPLNQSDDGVFKLAGEPLSVVAAGQQKRVLRFYADYPAANPDWLISLNPAQDLANPAATSRPGFSITDGGGNARLFLDATGRLGLGTNEPQGTIDARIGGSTNAWHRFVVTTTPGWGDAGSQHVTIGAGGAAGIMFANPHVLWNDNRASIRYGRTGGTTGDTYWDAGVRADGRFSFTANENGGGGEQVAITRAGLLSAKAGVVVEGGVAHIDRDGAFYRNVDGQVYITVDDLLYIRDSGSTTWAAQFETNSGSLNLKGTLSAAGAKLSGNAGMLDLEGTDHGYIQFYPQLRAGGRKGWIGYGGPGSLAMGIANEAGGLTLSGAGVSVASTAALSLSGTAVTIGGFTSAQGLAVNDGSNTGVGRGLWVWNSGDSNHVIYSANPQGKSPNGATPATGFHNPSHRMRFRTAEGQGFLFENRLEKALVDISSDTGDLWTLGRATLAGGLTIPKGQTVTGIPIPAFRTITLKKDQRYWRKVKNGQWQWDWSESYDTTVLEAYVAVGGSWLDWGREAGLKSIQIQPQIVKVGEKVNGLNSYANDSKSVHLRATFGWRDFTGDFDDNLDDGCWLDVLVIVVLGSVV